MHAPMKHSIICERHLRLRLRLGCYNNKIVTFNQFFLAIYDQYKYTTVWIAETVYACSLRAFN